MPFQGVRNQGAASGLQLALAIRAARMQEQKQEQDQMLARVKAAQDAEAVKVQRQKDALEIAAKTFEIQNTLQERGQGTSDLFAAANDPTLPDAQRQAAGNAAVGRLNESIVTRVGFGEDVNSAAVSAGQDVAIADAILAAQNRQADTTAEREDQFAQRREQRASETRIREGAIAERRAARRVGNEVRQITADIAEAEDRLESLTPGTRAFARQARQVQSLEARLLRMTNEGLPEAVAEAKKVLIQDVALLQGVDRSVKDLEIIDDYVAQQGPAFLGSIRGGGQEFIASLGETARDLTGLLGESVLADFRENPDIGLMPERQLRRLREDMRIDDGTLQRVADARALSARIAYIITRANNPGRFSNEQYRDTLSRIRLDKGTAEQSYRRLQTALGELRAISRETRDRVLLFNRALGPSGTGGFVDRRSGEGVLPAPEATGFGSFGGRVEPRAQPAQPDAVPFTELPPAQRQRRVEQILRDRGL